MITSTLDVWNLVMPTGTKAKPPGTMPSIRLHADFLLINLLASSGILPLNPVRALAMDPYCVLLTMCHPPPSPHYARGALPDKRYWSQPIGAEPRVSTKAADDSFIRKGGQSSFASFATSKGLRCVYGGGGGGAQYGQGSSCVPGNQFRYSCSEPTFASLFSFYK